MLRVFHVSDLHFGRPFVPEQIEAIEAQIAREKYDVVAVSGDVSQRARLGEFQRAQVFLRDAGRVSATICVPGNHDVAWWESPLGLRDDARMYEGYRSFISEELEPVLRVDGVTFVGGDTKLDTMVNFSLYGVSPSPAEDNGVWGVTERYPGYIERLDRGKALPFTTRDVPVSGPPDSISRIAIDSRKSEAFVTPGAIRRFRITCSITRCSRYCQ